MRLGFWSQQILEKSISHVVYSIRAMSFFSVFFAMMGERSGVGKDRIQVIEYEYD